MNMKQRIWSALTAAALLLGGGVAYAQSTTARSTGTPSTTGRSAGAPSTSARSTGTTSATTQPATGQAAGVQSASVQTATATATATATTTGYVVGVGDILAVTVYASGEKQEDFTDKVSPQGTITCPMIGPMKVAGMGINQIATQMKMALGRDYLVNPQVAVTVKEYAGQVTVMGEVRRPGVYPYTEGLTMLTATVLAGGFTDFASTKRVKLTRMVRGKPKLYEIDLGRVSNAQAVDPLIQRGDRVQVPRRWF
jgi:protein involved in polysaccharide export with SLBB domain